MDRSMPSDVAAENWLWSLPWTTAPEPKTDWSAVILCLREAAGAEFGDRWQQQGCADWADLIEALATSRSPEEAVAQFAESPVVAAECLEVRCAPANGR